MSNALNLPVLVFSAGLMMVVAALCGVAPAFQATRSGLPPLGERGSSAGRASAGTRKLLVAGQIALSLVLLACAGLFSRSLWNLVGNNYGFRAERVLTFSVNAGMNGYDADRGLNFYHDLLRRLKDLPGVDSVSMADAGPLSHSTHTSNVSIEGYTTKDGEEMDTVVISVGPGYFRTLGTPLIGGREFDERDGRTAPKAAVINDAFVRRFFGRQPPIGRHMSIGAGVPLDIVIAGVATDVRNSSLRDPARPTLYIPYEQSFEEAKRIRRASFFVRTAGGLDPLPAIIRRMVAQMDSTVPVFAMRTMEQQVEESVFTERLIAALSTAFGVLAMLLTAVGLYGVIAYLVTRRTSEIGVRMALGATRSNIAGMILREVLLLLCAGCAAGLAGAWLAGRALESQLFGIRSFDPVVFVTAPVVLAVVALFAASLPALRASRIQPLEALRHE